MFLRKQEEETTPARSGRRCTPRPLAWESPRTRLATEGWRFFRCLWQKSQLAAP